MQKSKPARSILESNRACQGRIPSMLILLKCFVKLKMLTSLKEDGSAVSLIGINQLFLFHWIEEENEYFFHFHCQASIQYFPMQTLNKVLLVHYLTWCGECWVVIKANNSGVDSFELLTLYLLVTRKSDAQQPTSLSKKINLDTLTLSQKNIHNQQW